MHVTVWMWWRSSTWTWALIIVSGFLLLKELCVLSRIHFLYLLKLVCFILSWGGIFTLVRLTSGRPSQCLNFGPSSEPWVISGVCLSLFSFPFHSVLGILSLIRRETQNSPAVYLCRRRSSPLYFTGNPSLCWPLASSGASSVSSRIG